MLIISFSKPCFHSSCVLSWICWATFLVWAVINSRIELILVQFSTTASSPLWARPDRLIVPVINRQTCRVSTRFHFNFNLFQFQQGQLGMCVRSDFLISPCACVLGGIIVWCLILLIFWKQQILRRKVFFWIWWEFSSVTSWIDWTNLILYWNSKNFQVLEWNSMLNAKWCDTLFLFLFQSSGWLSLKRRHIPAFNNSKAYPLLRKRGTYFPFQIFKEFLKVQALKDKQVGAWKSKPTFAFQCSHQKG